MGCAGEIQISEPDDYKHWTLDRREPKADHWFWYSGKPCTSFHARAAISTSVNDTKSLFMHSKVCMQYNGLKCTMSLTHHVAE